MTSPISLARSLAVAITLAVAVASPSVAQAQLVTVEPVGAISLVLGNAYIEHADGTRSSAQPGSVIVASDRIHTSANGHVHIRFVDQALVSVRPDSRLEIVQYDYNPDQPASSSIKLNLQEGVTRSISGHGATAARERFRLNTPIAAIGVRGTDFVVNASSVAVRAQVNEGTIVMAPFSADCTADAFGPCLVNAVELTGTSLQVLELDGSGTAPQILPATVEREPGMMQEEVSEAIAASEARADDKTAGTEQYLENVTAPLVKQEAANVAKPGKPTPPTVAHVDFTPEVALTAAQLQQNNLVWGRHGAGQGSLERITAPIEIASQGRDLTVGREGYILFRDGGGRERVDQGLGAISFELRNAQAFYNSGTGVVAMAVSGGSLDIDFNSRQFATELNMSHDLTGRIDFTASGMVGENGMFNNRTDSQASTMAGAISVDGKEAGYFFEQQLQTGGIYGHTLWNKR
jgi:hypothetical protein